MSRPNNRSATAVVHRPSAWCPEISNLFTHSRAFPLAPCSGLVALFAALADNTSLTALTFVECNDGMLVRNPAGFLVAAAAALARSLLYNTTLLELSFEDSEMGGSEAAALFFGALGGPDADTLLSSVPEAEESLQPAVAAEQERPHQVGQHCEEAEPEHVEEKQQPPPPRCRQQGCCALKTLKITRKGVFGADAAAALGRSLRRGAKLRRLELSDVSGAPVAVEVGRALAELGEKAQLAEVVMKKCGIDDAGARSCCCSSAAPPFRPLTVRTFPGSSCCCVDWRVVLVDRLCCAVAWLGARLHRC